MNFSIGKVSPVRVASLINKSLDSSKIQSAGIISPALNFKMSPGTTSSDEISKMEESRKFESAPLQEVCGPRS